MKHKKLLKYLSENNISVTDFAEMMGVHRTTILGWLSGWRKPPAKSLVKMHNVTSGKLTIGDFHGDEAMYG